MATSVIRMIARAMHLLFLAATASSIGSGSNSFKDLSSVFLRVFTPRPPAVCPGCSLHVDLDWDKYLQTQGIRFGENASYTVSDRPILQGSSVYNEPYFRKDAPTAVYIHGYVESAEALSVRTVVDAYLRRGDHNIVVVDWGVLAFQTPILASFSTYHIGKQLASVIDDWVTLGFDLSSVHLIGHSMGAHVAGFTGQFVKSGRIPRMTALDPVGIGFYATDNRSFHLDKSDTDFLDVIHTDGGHYGLGIPIGHVDFYPNGGRALQPGCPKPEGFLTPKDLCSHWLSWRLYSESLVNTVGKNLLLGRQCQSWTLFLKNRCRVQVFYNVIRMGFYTPSSARGKYFLTTRGRPLHGRGLQGIQP